MLYTKDDPPREVASRRVLAFVPVLSYNPDQLTHPSGVVARVIVPEALTGLYAVLSIAWQADDGTWLQDGVVAELSYEDALRALTRRTLRQGEFAHSVH
jgi:hypothetical protein